MGNEDTIGEKIEVMIKGGTVEVVALFKSTIVGIIGAMEVVVLVSGAWSSDTMVLISCDETKEEEEKDDVKNNLLY